MTTVALLGKTFLAQFMVFIDKRYIYIVIKFYFSG